LGFVSDFVGRISGFLPRPAAWYSKFARRILPPFHETVMRVPIRPVASLVLALVAGPLAADAPGDPLPKGAVARLGSLRWRFPAQVTSASFSGDGTLLAVSLSGGDEAPGVCVVEVPGGRVRHRLPRGEFDGALVAFAPRGRLLALAAGGRGTLWDLDAGKAR
jgi:hypothetical protein